MPKVLARDLGRGQLAGREDRALAAQEEALGELPVKAVVPAPALRGAAVLMGCGHGREVGLLDGLGLLVGSAT